MRAYCRQRRWPLPRAVINAGFTMVEVLVALMIIATGLIAALRAAGGVTKGNHDFIVQRITAATPNPNFRSVEMIVRDSAQTHEWARLVTVLPNEPRQSSCARARLHIHRTLSG